MTVEVEELDVVLVFWREVAVKDDVDVGVAACSEVSAAGVGGNRPAFQLPFAEELLCLGVGDVQVDVDVPDLRATVSFLGSIELLCELLPFGSGVDGFGMDCTDDKTPALQAYLSADGFVVVERSPALLREDGLFLEHNGAFAIVLVLRSRTAFVDFVLGVNDQGVSG